MNRAWRKAGCHSKFMAIKIDLLPRYVKLKRNLHRSIAACLVVTGAVAGLLLVILQQRRLELETVKTNLQTAQTVVAQVTTATSEKTTALTGAAPIANAVSFMTAASKTGSQRAALLHLVRQYIYEDAIVSSIDISDGQKVVILATVRTPDEYARFLLNLRRSADVNGGTLFKGLPLASGPRGFANGAAPFVRPNGNGTADPIPLVYPVSVRAEGFLLNPVLLPPDPVGAPGALTPGASTAASGASAS